VDILFSALMQGCEFAGVLYNKPAVSDIIQTCLSLYCMQNSPCWH